MYFVGVEYFKMILETLTSIGTLGAVLIGGFAIYYSNKNSRREIRTHKLEEIFELSESLSINYYVFKDLYFDIEELKNRNNIEIQTYNDYYKIRDKRLTLNDKNKIQSDLIRFEVLARCYTRGYLLKELLDYKDLMHTFLEYVFVGGSLRKEIKWKDGFPNFKDFHQHQNVLREALINQINN
ncbi:hypothetical protein [Salibacter halophilus]|nr:hypothetical protein [Salibacter halophilus]